MGVFETAKMETVLRIENNLGEVPNSNEK